MKSDDGSSGLTPVSLGPKEAVADRPFTAVELIDRDLETLSGMLDDLITILGEVDDGSRTIEPNERISWAVDQLARRLLVCNEEKLRGHQGLCVVGFFGERRQHVEVGPLETANAQVVAQFKDYPGILSYSSVELPDGYWANMVLHNDLVDREYWRRSTLHAEAARSLSPLHYKTVRIHNLRLIDRVMNHPDFALKRTKYWDYSEEPEWTAVREMDDPGWDSG